MHTVLRISALIFIVGVCIPAQVSSDTSDHEGAVAVTSGDADDTYESTAQRKPKSKPPPPDNNRPPKPKHDDKGRPPKEKPPQDPPGKGRPPKEKPPLNRPDRGKTPSGRTGEEPLPDPWETPPEQTPALEIYVDCGYYESTSNLEDATIYLAYLSTVVNIICVLERQSDATSATVGFAAGGISLMLISGGEDGSRFANLIAGSTAIILGALNTGMDW